MDSVWLKTTAQDGKYLGVIINSKLACLPHATMISNHASYKDNSCKKISGYVIEKQNYRFLRHL